MVRNYEVLLDINSNEHAFYKVRKAVTIFDQEARDAGKFAIYYGGFQEIQKVDGSIYDSNGKLIRKLNENDIIDISLSGGYSLYEDTRTKIFELYYNSYPYTVEYEYTIELEGLLNLPAFYPQNRNEYVELARLEVSVPREHRLKYHTSGIPDNVQKIITERDSVFTWELKDLEPAEKEPYGKSFVEVTPRVLLAVNSFKMDESSGRLDTWNHFGQWYYELSKGRDELPENAKKEISGIFRNADDTLQGIQQLFEYMQNKTRYVSIQLGIGGWQPFDAMYVEEKGYGDCKALTNYMQAILNHVGIEAYPVLIKNGISEPDIVTEFPSNQFNHVILWIPELDTVWLESTSQSIPFNYIGYSNSNRHGLAVTPDSSFLIKTPSYDYRTNKLRNVLEIELEGSGKAEINMQSTYSGYYLDKLLAQTSRTSDSAREKWIYNNLKLNSFRIKSMDFTDIEKRIRKPNLNIEVSANGYATQTGNRLFIPVNKLNRWGGELPSMDTPRTEVVDLGYSFHEKDESIINFPTGYSVEAIPASVQIHKEFGKYELRVNKKSSNELSIHRMIEIRKKELPAEYYEELRQFFTRVREYDSKSVVLAKN